MLRRSASALAVLIACALAPARSAEVSTPQPSGARRAIALDAGGRLNLGDLSWLTWHLDEDKAKRADWQSIKNWLAFRKSEMTAVMRRKLAALHVDRDVAKLPVHCFEDLLCTELDIAVEKAEHFDDLVRLKAALSEIEPIYRTFIDMDGIAKSADEQSLGKEPSFQVEIISRQMRDQAEQQAEHVLRNRVSDDGKILLVQLLRIAWRQTTFENAPFLETHVAKEGWPTIARYGRAATFAWLTAQHADHAPDFQWRMLQLMQPLLDKGEVKRSHYAYLYDRVNVNLGLPQRYGSQYHCVKGKLELEALENPDKVDTLRKQMDLPPLARNVEQACSGE
jgi:hypothetical protein